MSAIFRLPTLAVGSALMISGLVPAADAQSSSVTNSYNPVQAAIICDGADMSRVSDITKDPYTSFEVRFGRERSYTGRATERALGQLIVRDVKVQPVHNWQGIERQAETHLTAVVQSEPVNQLFTSTGLLVTAPQRDVQRVKMGIQVESRDQDNTLGFNEISYEIRPENIYQMTGAMGDPITHLRGVETELIFAGNQKLTASCDIHQSFISEMSEAGFDLQRLLDAKAAAQRPASKHPANPRSGLRM